MNDLVKMEVSNGVANVIIEGKFRRPNVAATSQQKNNLDIFAELITDYLNNLAPETTPKIMVNLKECDFMDSNGLAELIKVRKKLDIDARGEIVIVDLQGSVKSMFDLTRLIYYFKICSSEQRQND